jgi:hypothetical protein
MRVATGDSKKPAKTKNIERNIMGDTTGRIHMKHQDLSKVVQFKGMKALKKKRKHDGSGETGSADAKQDAGSEQSAASSGSAASAAAPAASASKGAGSAYLAELAAGEVIKPKKKERLKGQARWAQSKRQRT